MSAFISARFDRIETLRPDLILAFSDLQADIVAELVRRGDPVFPEPAGAAGTAPDPALAPQERLDPDAAPPV